MYSNIASCIEVIGSIGSFTTCMPAGFLTSSSSIDYIDRGFIYRHLDYSRYRILCIVANSFNYRRTIKISAHSHSHVCVYIYLFRTVCLPTQFLLGVSHKK